MSLCCSAAPAEDRKRGIVATTPPTTQATPDAKAHLEALADVLRDRDHTATVSTDATGRTVLKAGHPAVPSMLTVAIHAGVADGGVWHFLWEWGEALDLPVDDLDAVAERVSRVLGVAD
jgi:hypothetical protein